MAEYSHEQNQRLAAKLLEQQGHISDLTAQRDGAYRERAQLLAWLATVVPAILAPALDVDEPGWQLLFLTPGGTQLTWHIAPSDVQLFEHVERVGPDDPRARWDGHSTDEKYQRIRQLTFGQLRGATCDASMDLNFTNPVGPCVLRHGHDGPVHQDGAGATWWPRQ